MYIAEGMRSQGLFTMRLWGWCQKTYPSRVPAYLVHHSFLEPLPLLLGEGYIATKSRAPTVIGPGEPSGGLYLSAAVAVITAPTLHHETTKKKRTGISHIHIKKERNR